MTASPAIHNWPVHPAQRGLLDAKAGPRRTGGNSAFAYQVSGPLQPERLLAAYRRAAADFDALRLRLVADPDPAGWCLDEAPRLAIRQQPANAEQLPGGDARARATAAAIQRAATRFDPACGPLGSVDLIPAGAGTWIVVEAFDHIVADGRALTLLHQAVSRHYAAARLRPPASAPTYRSVLQIAADRRARPDRLRFWRDWYRGFDPTHHTADVNAAAPRSRELRYDPVRVAAIERAAGRCRATLAATLLTAHAHAVARHTGSGDIATFLAVDGRDPPAGDVFGQVTSLLPIRVTHQWAQRLGTHLSATARRLLEVREHMDVDVHDLDQCHAPTQLAAADATAFIFQDQPVQPPPLADLTVHAIELPDQHDAGGLTTVVHRDTDGGIRLRIRTPAGSALHRHLDSITATVDTFVDILLRDPDCPAGDDALLPATAARFIHQLAEPTPPYPFRPVDRAILQRLRDSDRTAVIENGRGYSARELLAAIHRRTRALRGAGVGPRQAVVVDDTTAFERIASLLAILRLGAVYVPVEPTTPLQTRTDLERRSAAVALLNRHGATRLPPAQREPSNSHAGEPQPTTAVRDGVPGESLTPHDPAYVIFTSGTTGQPKGVLISRGALSNLAHGEGPRFAIGEDSRVLLTAPVTADPWLCHVTGTLIAGGALVAVELHSDASLSEQLDRAEVTHAFLPAALFAQLEPRPYPHLKMVATAGDHCRTSAVRRMLPRAVFNIYGPTEATVTATIAALAEPVSPTPIGRPIRGLGARVMIDGQASAPPDVIGELTITGIGLAIGYLNDPDLTRARFQPDPLRPGHRLYVTGDRAWLGHDGQFYLAGRTDRQVKIRGHRVELGHLESAARATGLCTDAYAVTTSDQDRRLVLIVEGCSQPDQLAYALTRALPPPARPRTVTAVERLPRHTSGKVDASRLPAILGSDAAPEPDDTELSALGPAARILGPVWRQLLGGPAHPASDFFALGGDSLDVLRLVREARHLGLPITPTMVYRHSRFADLLDHLAPQPDQPDAGPTSDPTRDPPDDLRPLGPTQQWFFRLDLPEPARWNQQYHLAFAELPEPSALSQALTALLCTTPLLSAHLTAAGIRYPRQPEPAPNLTVINTPVPDDKLRYLLDSLHKSLSPARGALIRSAALRAPDGSGLLLLVAHHLVVDDWSWQVIDDRLRRLLAADPRQEPATLDQGFARFTSAIARQAAAGAFTLDAAAWDAIHRSGRTADGNARPATTHRLHATMGGAPHRLAAIWNVPLPAVLLGCLAHGLERIEPGGTTVIDLERNGRSAVHGLDTSDAVGWFALHHPLPIAHTGLDATTAVGLATSLAAIPDSGLSFGLLRGASAGVRPDRIGRLAVNIAAVPESVPTPLLDQVRRCTVPATGTNHLPYEGSLVFRLEPAAVRAELTFDPDRLSPATATALLHALAEAPTQSRPRPRDRPLPVPHPFDDPIPATAMQQLMLEAARHGPGIYRPRQLLTLDSPRSGDEDFLASLEVVLGTLDPFRRRFHRTPTGFQQQCLPAAATVIDRRPGGLQAALLWLDEPDAVDADAATRGGPLVSITAFSAPPEPLCLGIQVHHAVLDGPSNRRLLTHIADLLDAHHTTDPGQALTAPPSDSSGTTARKHASAECARGTPAPMPVRTNIPARTHAHREESIVPADTAARIASWAHHHGVDVRAAYAAAALATAHRAIPGEQVYLVGNGRDPDIPGAEDALGMFWYFQPLTPATDDPVTLARQVFETAAQPLRDTRLHAFAWPTWLDGHGMSFNFLKPDPTQQPSRVHARAHIDLFHIATQVEVTTHAGGQTRIRWTTLPSTPDPTPLTFPQFADYVAVLHHLAASASDHPHGGHAQ